MNNSVQVLKISNGFVVTTYPTAPTTTGPVQTYCADLTAVQAMLVATFGS